MESSDNDTLTVAMDDSSSKSITSSEPDIESLTDGKSEHFNPLIALYLEESVSLKSEIAAEAPAYLHVFELEKAVPDPKEAPVKESSIKRKIANRNTQKTVAEISTPVAVPATAGDSTQGDRKAEPYYPIPGRKFLPHQLPVYRPRKEHPNVITSMETIEGPLAVLRDVMKSKRRIKVWTRNNTGIRGFCTGIVLGFDSHWNIVMGNVEEYFQRQRAVPNSKSQSQPPVTSRNENSVNPRVFNRKKQEESIIVDGKDALAALRALMKFWNVSKMPTNKNASTRSVSAQENQSSSSTTTKLSKSQIRKKALVILRQPEKDVFGYNVLARSQYHEIVHRLQKNLFLIGNEIAFVESKLA